MTPWQAAHHQARKIASAKTKRGKKAAARACCVLLRQALTGVRARA